VRPVLLNGRRQRFERRGRNCSRSQNGRHVVRRGKVVGQRWLERRGYCFDEQRGCSDNGRQVVHRYRRLDECSGCNLHNTRDGRGNFGRHGRVVSKGYRRCNFNRHGRVVSEGYRRYNFNRHGRVVSEGYRRGNFSRNGRNNRCRHGRRKADRRQLRSVHIGAKAVCRQRASDVLFQRHVDKLIRLPLCV
jgi:hypothetical protein